MTNLSSLLLVEKVVSSISRLVAAKMSGDGGKGERRDDGEREREREREREEWSVWHVA